MISQLGKGTGLGLSSVYEIVAQSNGGIVVQNEINVGATFNILLPRTQATNREPQVNTDDQSLMGSEVTVLLVNTE